MAAEVRALAQRSAEAAKEIKALIGESVQQVDAGGGLVDAAGRTMGEIVESVQQVTGLMSSIHLASREQSSGIESINASVAKLERVTQRNSGVVDDAGRTAATLNAQTVSLMRSVAGFELGAREHGTREEAHAMVKAAVEFCRTHGKEALVADIGRLNQGRFVDRDLYLVVYRLQDSVLLAHGSNPRMVGFKTAKSTDVDGRPFIAEILEGGARRGSGWIDYKWAHPVTNEAQAKTSYFERVDDIVITCGAYKQ